MATTPELVREAFALLQDDEEISEERLVEYLENVDAKLRALRHVRNAALTKRQVFLDEAEKLIAIATGLERTAKRVEQTTLTMLRADRAIARVEGTYKAELGDGTKLTLRVRVSERTDVERGAIDDLPEEFVRVVKEPNKVAIKAALQAGRAVPGCSLVEGINESVEGW